MLLFIQPFNCQWFQMQKVEIALHFGCCINFFLNTFKNCTTDILVYRPSTLFLWGARHFSLVPVKGIAIGQCKFQGAPRQGPGNMPKGAICLCSNGWLLPTVVRHCTTSKVQMWWQSNHFKPYCCIYIKFLSLTHFEILADIWDIHWG